MSKRQRSGFKWWNSLHKPATTFRQLWLSFFSLAGSRIWFPIWTKCARHKKNWVGRPLKFSAARAFKHFRESGIQCASRRLFEFSCRLMEGRQVVNAAILNKTQSSQIKQPGGAEQEKVSRVLVCRTRGPRQSQYFTAVVVVDKGICVITLLYAAVNIEMIKRKFPPWSILTNALHTVWGSCFSPVFLQTF